MQKLILIDGNSLINRAYYATPPFTAKDGTPTNAVFGFVNMFLKLVETEKPSHVCVAFDVHHPTFRHELYADYKGTRKLMPEDLRPQVPLLKDVLQAMGVATISLAGYEADDLIGTLSALSKVPTVIVTGDRDSFQLVDEKTKVYFTRRGITDVDVIEKENFFEKTGISPEEVIELKALQGDASDNIPGIAGVGEKTALTLIETYHTVENLYAHADELTGKLKEKVLAGKDSAELSRRLATIDRAVPLSVSFSDFAFSTPFPKEAKRVFFSLDFQKFLSRADLFSDEDGVGVSPAFGADVPTVLITDENRLSDALTAGRLSACFSEDGLHVYDGKTEYVVKERENLLEEGVSPAAFLAFIRRLFSEKELIVFKKKDLKHKLDGLGVPFTAASEDVALMKYLVAFSGKDEDLSSVLYGENLPEDKPAFGLWTLFDRYKEMLEKENTVSLYRDVELPLSDVLYDMETAGFQVDENALASLSEEYGGRMRVLESEIHRLTGDETFNVNSPKQLGNVLFEKMGIPYPEKKKTGGYSTASEILEELAGDYPVCDVVLKYRQMQKLVSTYIEGFRPVIDKRTGRIHTSFEQTATATGRLSSKAPNLQNIPVRDEEGKSIRKVFVARDKEHVLIGADYSQIELRLLAAFSGSELLKKAFNEGKDVHAETAARVFNVAESAVTKEMRRSAKAVNFGIIYGISDYGLAKNLKISPKAAREVIDKYFATYPEVKAYMDENVAFAKKNGYVTTLLGRRRSFPDILSKNFNLRSYAERAAMNMPLQGSSADIIKLAMIAVHRRLKKENLQSELILTIHDELIVDALKSEKESVVRILTEEMEHAVSLSVSLTVETEIGETWFEAK